MTDKNKCEYCLRPIKGEPTFKILRGQEHVFCTEFCFRLHFYDVPRITYQDLQKMYDLRCVSIKSPDFRTLVYRED